MNKVWEFLKVKGFYIALGTGLVAFVALIAVYSYDNNTVADKEDKVLDLNQGAVDDVDVVPSEEELAKVEDTTDGTSLYEDGVPGEVQMVDKDTTEETDQPTTLGEDADSFQDGDTKPADETIINQETVDVLSGDAFADGQVVENQVDTQIEVGLSYNGEQVLAWPLVGNVVLPYSMDTTVYFQTLDIYKCNPGMLISGEEGADVMSVYEGEVKEVTTTKEFGTVVKVDLGNGYELTYGQLMNVTLAAGDSVSLGDNIGEVAPPSNHYKKEGTHLYFAITKDGTPVNPMLLIR